MKQQELASGCDHVYVAPCAVGRGLFAARPIAKGELILSLTGPRFTKRDPIHFTDEGANLLQIGRFSYILLQAPAVFANHSCRPNAGIANDYEMVAIRDIAVGEEICFDYSTTMEENFWTLECACGQPGCRGRITDFHLLPADLKADYLARGIVQKFIVRRCRKASA